MVGKVGKVYKSWCPNALELSFILNLVIIAVATYHVTLSHESQAAVAYTSVGIAFQQNTRIVALFPGPAQLFVTCMQYYKRWKAGRDLGTRLLELLTEILYC